MGVIGINVCTPDPLDDGTLSLFPNSAPGVDNLVCLPPKAPWPMASMDMVFQIALPFVREQEGRDEHPEWPGGDSGVTWGIGFDAGAESAAQIKEIWKDLPAKDLERLAACAGLHGEEAKKKAAEVKDIKISTGVSDKVYMSTEMPKYYKLLLGGFPGTERLPAHTQAALLSMTYNRGTDLGHAKTDKKGHTVLDRRYEMREIHFAIEMLDLQTIADELRTMERVWTKGSAKDKKIAKDMTQRREAEAGLVDFDIGLYLNGWSCRAP